MNASPPTLQTDNTSCSVKIAIRELRIGMFVIRVEGAWMSHGLWRTRFLVDDAETLRKVLHCGASELWIDTTKGIGPEPRPARTPPVAARPIRPNAAMPPKDRHVSLEHESRGAANICRRGGATVASMFAEIAAGRAPDLASAGALVDDIVDSVHRNANALIGISRLKTKDNYTYLHSVAVCTLMVSLAIEMGCDGSTCRRMGLGGLLHDVGKATIPLEILNKPGPLTADEFAEVKEHSRRGFDLLSQAGFEDDIALDVCLHHHEKIGGRGYPDSLSGDRVSLAARMGAICDVYDAVTSPRPYKAAWDPGEALREMCSWTDHFDRNLLATFVKTVGIYPIGALVRLASGRLAIVVENRADNLAKPVVRVFYSTKSQIGIPLERLDLAACDKSDRILGREPRESWSPQFFASITEQIWGER